jgi:serine/threonine protein kinase
MFVSLCGYFPYVLGIDQLRDSIKFAEYWKTFKLKYDTKYWYNISKEAKDLISNMIELDPQKRFTIEQVVKSEWFTKTKGVRLALN